MDTEATRILVVEDNPGDVRLIREQLAELPGRPFEVSHAGDLSLALHALRRSAFDAVLLDLGLPDSQGLETLARMRAGTPGTPVIVLTGLSDEAVGFQAVRSGAQDYLFKGEIEAAHLARSIRYAIERKQTEQALKQSVAQLEAKSEELESFTYSVSHDIKEPLRTIEAFSQFLLEDHAGRLDEQGRDYLTRMAKASARLKQMIEEVLMLSRVGRRLEDAKRVDTARVVADIAAAMDAAIKEKGAAVIIEDDLPDVLAEGARVEQVFGNLIANALKFSLGDCPEVRIGVREQDKGEVVLFVKDNGIGIEPEYHEQIFGMFQRLHRREAFEGTGAGLAIVKRAVESMGGRIWLDSEPGLGTTFFVALPPATALPSMVAA